MVDEAFAAAEEAETEWRTAEDTDKGALALEVEKEVRLEKQRKLIENDQHWLRAWTPRQRVAHLEQCDGEAWCSMRDYDLIKRQLAVWRAVLLHEKEGLSIARGHLEHNQTRPVALLFACDESSFMLPLVKLLLQGNSVCVFLTHEAGAGDLKYVEDIQRDLERVQVNHRLVQFVKSTDVSDESAFDNLALALAKARHVHFAAPRGEDPAQAGSDAAARAKIVERNRTHLE